MRVYISNTSVRGAV